MCDIAARRSDICPAAAPIDFTWLNLGKAPRIFLNTHAQAPSESSTNVKWGDDLMGGIAQGISNGGGGRGRAASAVKMPCSHVTLEVLFPLLYLDNISRQHHRIWAYNGEGKFCSGAVFKTINSTNHNPVANVHPKHETFAVPIKLKHVVVHSSDAKTCEFRLQKKISRTEQNARAACGIQMYGA